MTVSVLYARMSVCVFVNIIPVDDGQANAACIVCNMVLNERSRKEKEESGNGIALHVE